MKNLTIIVLSFLFVFIACGDGAEKEKSLEAKYAEADLHAENISSKFVSANNIQALKLFGSLNEAGENIMISPLSVSIAMAMALNGASDDNFDEMKSVLEYDSMTIEEINTGFYNLINSLVDVDKDMTLSLADSIWMNEGSVGMYKEDYSSLLENKYNAEPYVIDFFSGDAVDTINGWVSDNTNGKIKDILEEISPNAVMFLINAVYFNSAWTVAFDKENTNQGYFTKSGGDTVTVDYMRFINQMLEYGNSGTFRVIRLPYGRGKISFYGIIPRNGGTVDELISQIIENGFENYSKYLTEKPVNVILPKFKFEYSNDLVGVFKSLGMSMAFDKGPFGGIADCSLFISEIIHKTFIEVSESGTEAAAATDVEIDAGDSGDTSDYSEPEGFFATKPFVYIIRDDRTGTILFMGKVEDPTVEE